MSFTESQDLHILLSTDATNRKRKQHDEINSGCLVCLLSLFHPKCDWFVKSFLSVQMDHATFYFDVNSFLTPNLCAIYIPLREYKAGFGIPFSGNWLRELLFNGKEKSWHETTAEGKYFWSYNISNSEYLTTHKKSLSSCFIPYL